MAARGLFSLVSLVLVAGALLLMLFIVLAGAINSNPVNKWYFLEVNTANIPGAPTLSRWTYWSICDGASGSDACSRTSIFGGIQPARPFDPPRNFNTATNIPAAFIGTSRYYLMSRFMFAFMLIALFFSGCALLTGVLALCTRIGAYLSGFLASVACLFQALNAALMTVTYVYGRNIFNANGQAATIGRYAFGFEWGAFAALLLATVFFCLGGGGRKDTTYGSKGGRFGRSKSTRSRGSFINADKEYA